ncbi:B-cell antigen receptor complex-associated protein alpha chain-like isoform X3 [Salvelinus sp. IW2-2015]|uniref:B-cell antigen receptor complex-associated protein alpha chain-like isoform X3 n=1 Tax=Salvelinus sp. IW2-2015 TaxID=2691554 RepID=UPI000CDFC2F4|nr:B-cell antigen receptor complex-associated protein alpha chain-like isoform X3 [Salvelinus alpinus]
MVAVTFLFLCFWAAGVHGDLSRIQVTLEPDRPSLRVQLSHTAHLRCCYSATRGAVETTWYISIQTVNGTSALQGVDRRDNRVTVDEGNLTAAGVMCHTLILKEARLNDSGLYQCFLNHSALRHSVYTHGTFLQVYRPMVKILDIGESTKNSILTAEGMLLMVAVLLHGTMMLYEETQSNEEEKGQKGRGEYL